MRLCTLPAIAVALVLAGLALPSAAQEGKDDLAKQELKKFQGTWSIVGIEQNGEKVPEDKLKGGGMKVTIKGTSYTVRVGDKTVDEGTFTVDPSKNPKQLDAQSSSQGKKEKLSGIYQFEGDTLRICFVPEGKERPAEFKTPAGSDRVLETLRRDK
jgi:uncharacterized protein (TIGR03067 family)